MKECLYFWDYLSNNQICQKYLIKNEFIAKIGDFILKEKSIFNDNYGKFKY